MVTSRCAIVGDSVSALALPTNRTTHRVDDENATTPFEGVTMHAVNERQLNSGLLIMRLGIAATLLYYALPRLLGGTRLWIKVGKDLRFLDADISAQIVGFILLLIEVLASVGLITGGLFRISTALLATVYSLYFFNFINIGYRTLPLYAAALACVCIGMMFVGPGRFAVAVKIEKK